MTAIVLALLSAVGYGASDFGMAARRGSYVHVAIVVQVVGAVAVLVALLFARGTFHTGALAWGAVSGLGAGLGTLALYRGLAQGQTAVAGPISGVGAAGLPVLVGLALGERPSALTLIGVGLALPAVWLVAGGGGDGLRSLAGGSVEGLLAGVGFGVLFLALAQAPPGTGLWPSAASVVVSATTVTLVGLVVSPQRAETTGDRHAWFGAAVAGILGAAGPVLFLLSSRHGLLVVVAVLAALYPAVTVLLARIVARERSGRGQIAGLILAAGAVIAITAG